LGDDGLLVVVAGDEANVGRLLLEITDDLLERNLEEN
jgi:predicted regulator of Ras-like GTPase activity (Roadblock/LC7/MglB family)